MAYTDIDKPTDYFNTVLYTGNGSSGHAITGVGFQPDFLWLKPRSTTGYHRVFDVVRGAGKQIYPNETNQENTDTNQMSAFNSDGFTLGNETGSNANGTTFVAWNWLAGGSASSNSNGSITSSVSASTDAGCSIVTVANVGSANFTFGHGLGVAPSWVLAKSRNGGKWNNYFKSLGAGYTIQLGGTSGTNAKISNTTMWQNTNPTSSVVYSNGDQLDANESYVFYCFAEKQGYSKFGSYTGNGNTNGSFVYLGFKPAFVMIKSSSNSGQSWVIQDNKRDGFNYNNHRLFANSSGAEETTVRMDLLSNGFKCRDNDGNGNGFSYIYMAFAENPFVSSTGVPATAR